MSFSVSRVENIFELKVPRLQINGGIELEKERELQREIEREEKEREKEKERRVSGSTDVDVDERKKALRREIKRWWEGIADHIDKLVRLFFSNQSFNWN